MNPSDLFQQFQSIKTLETTRTCYEFHYLDTVGSTNSYAKRYQGKTPALFLSPDQTEGRGRFEREWVSPPYSGLSFTALYSELPFRENPGLIPILCAVSITEAINELYGLKTDIKWPNDIYLDNGKIAGILVESIAQKNRIEKFIIGMGINLYLPEEERARKQLADLPTNPRFLEEFMVFPPDPLALLEKTVTLLDKYLFSNNPDEIVRKWMSFCPHIGKKNSFTYRGEKHSGIINRLKTTGELVVTINNSEITLSSSDISFK